MSWTNKLQQVLAEPLPGLTAHRIMNPLAGQGGDEPKLGLKESGVLLMLFQQEEEWFFPLIQRATYKGVHSGQMALPGGRREEEDENLIVTALREAEEEVGIERHDVTVIGHLSCVEVAASNHLVQPIVGYHQGLPEFIPDAYEVAEVVAVPVQELHEAALQQTSVQLAQGFRKEVPCFILQDKVVWGATAMMLIEFKLILEKIL